MPKEEILFERQNPSGQARTSLMTALTAPYRAVPVGEAIALAFTDLARLGLTAQLEIFPGETNSVHQCSLHAPSTGRVVARSTGKGMGAQSLASALFEALELYFTATDQNRLLQDDDTMVLSARDVAEQPPLSQDLVVKRLATYQPEAPVGCMRMQDLLANDAVSVWYPLMLTDPGYTLHPLAGDPLAASPSLRRYCTSSGTAAGLTTAEALAHALCEWIEYDAISHALLRWFVARCEQPMIVDRTSAPTSLELPWAELEKVVGTDVVLIDITTDLDIPSFLAVPFRPQTTTALWGAGAAPDPLYAAERALSELLQVAKVYAARQDHYARSQTRMLERLSRWPALRRACQCDISGLFGGAPAVTVPFRPSTGSMPDAEALVVALLELLRTRGMSCLAAPLQHPELNTKVLAVRVPGLERFGGQVIAGYPVLPTGRGTVLWPEGSHA